MKEKQEEALTKIPNHLHKTFIKAWSGKSRQYAIKAMCYACIGYDKKEIENCLSITCPLHAYRPLPKRGVPKKKNLQNELTNEKRIE